MKRTKINKRTKKFPAWPHYEADEIEAVSKVLQSGKVNYWTGQECKLFEKEFADYIGMPYAISLANGSLALELALYVYDIGVGDEVITTSRTFIASASAAVMRGATPIIADIDHESGNITAETIAQKISPRTKAIIVVHLAGWPAEMDEIMALAKKHDIKVIEDVAQAHGAKYKGQMAGSIADISAFSFCQDKIISTGGEGGMLLLKDEAEFKKAWSYKDHGKGFDTVYHKKHPVGFRYLHDSFGTNWRMTEMQAAIGRAQLKKLPKWLAERKRNAAILTERLSDIKALRIPRPPEYIEHAYYKYFLYVNLEQLQNRKTRTDISDGIFDRGVFCRVGSCSEIYLEQAFRESDFAVTEPLKIAQEFSETAMMLLVHPGLSENDMHDMADVVEYVVGELAEGNE